MDNNRKIYRLGLIEQKKHELSRLRTLCKSHKEAIDFLLFKEPFNLEKIDINSLRTLSEQLLAELEKFGNLKREIDDLEGQ